MSKSNINNNNINNINSTNKNKNKNKNNKSNNNTNDTKAGFHKERQNSTIFPAEWMTFICSFIASIGLFCNGTFVGWSSHITDYFQSSSQLSTKDIAYVSSSLAFGAAVSPIMVHKLWQFIGTKICVIISCIFMISAWILLTFNTNFWLLITGRIIGGFAVGTLHFLIPIYIYDISTIEQKSILDCIMNSQFAFGILAQYAINTFTYPFLACVLAAVAPFIYLISFLLLPESPRFLCFQGKTSAGKDILKKYKHIDNDVEEDIRIWCREQIKEKNLKNIVHTAFGAKQIIPIFGLVIFEQFIGSISILFYLDKIFKLTHGEYPAYIQTIMCCTIFAISISLLEILGFNLKNKNVLFWTTICMSVSLGVLGIHCHYQGTFGELDEYRQISLLSICAFYLFYAIGPYRLTWIYVHKLTPKSNYFTIRCLLVSIMWLIIGCITRVLPYLINVIGVGWLFWNMSSLCLFTTIFMTIFVPDLKKLPDEQLLVENGNSTAAEDSNDA